MSDQDSSEAWKRLSAKLAARRVELDPAYRNLAEFARATGLHYRTVQRAEAGKPHKFASPTLKALDQAYGYHQGGIQRILAGKEPHPLWADRQGDAPQGEEEGVELVGESGRVAGAWPLDPDEVLTWTRGDEPGWRKYTLSRPNGYVVGRAFPISGTTPRYIIRTLQKMLNRAEEVAEGT